MAGVVFPAMLPDSQPREGEVAAQLDAGVKALQARELLEPVLLLSAGYLAVPFLLGQLRLLLTPLLLLLGVSLQEVRISPTGISNEPKEGRQHDLL